MTTATEAILAVTVYPKGVCPVCGRGIPATAVLGDECQGTVTIAGGGETELCGHVFCQNDPALYQTADLSKMTPVSAAESVDEFISEQQEVVNPGILGSKGKDEQFAGDFVLRNQTTGKEQGFSHVSKIWLDQCISFDEGIARMQELHRQVVDIRGPLSDWETVVEDAAFLFKHKPTGRTYEPTPKCIRDFAAISKAVGGAASALLGLKDEASDDEETAAIWKRDEKDAATLKMYVDHHIFHPERVDQKKERLFRTWNTGDNTGSLRAILSDQYAILDNVEVLRIFQRLLPGGMLSHWKSNADEIWGNVLINDTIRAETDSQYGAGLSIGNSEIGTRTVYSLPMVFRAICMNGCIWDKESGEAYRKPHRGQIDYAALEDGLNRNIQRQIPLLKEGIDSMLATRGWLMTGANPKQVVAQVTQDYRLSKKQAQAVWTAYGVEVGILAEGARSAFGVIQALTRAGQTFDRNDLWVKFDETGGALMGLGMDKWGSLVKRAANLSDKQIEKLGLLVE